MSTPEEEEEDDTYTLVREPSLQVLPLLSRDMSLLASWEKGLGSWCSFHSLPPVLIGAHSALAVCLAVCTSLLVRRPGGKTETESSRRDLLVGDEAEKMYYLCWI